MAALSATTLTHTAAATWPATPGAAADTTNGDTVPNGGSTILVMNNTAGASGTVTIRTPGTVDGLPVEDRVFTIPANTIQLTKLGSPAHYGSPTRIDCSAATIRIAAYAI